MTYEEFVKDFAERTVENLEIVENNVEKNNDGYEVTQLINSMIGLLIFPQQKYYEEFPEKYPNDDIKKMFAKSSEYKNEQENFKTMVRHLRNAVSHNNIEVIPYGTQEHIKRFEFVDKNPKGDVTAKITLTVEEIKILLKAMLEEIKTF